MNVTNDYHTISITSRRSNCALWWDPVDRIAPGPAWLGARSRVAPVTIAGATSHVLRNADTSFEFRHDHTKGSQARAQERPHVWAATGSVREVLGSEPLTTRSSRLSGNGCLTGVGFCRSKS